MTEKPKPEEWIKAAERMGNQLAEGIERFGDRVQRMVESIDENTRKRRVKVEDRRDEVDTIALDRLKLGEVFDYDGKLYLRMGRWPDGVDLDGLWAVHLTEGSVRKFDDGTMVSPVDAKVTVTRREGDNGERTDSEDSSS